jgi:hypothetical protein
MTNPFRRFLTKEHLFHEACVIWLKCQYPKLLFTHPINEGKRTPFERFLYKILGVRSGMPDLLIFQSKFISFDGNTRQFYAGLAIEFKVPGKKPSAVQVACHQDLIAAGWRVIVVDTTGQFIREVTNYMMLKSFL